MARPFPALGALLLLVATGNTAFAGESVKFQASDGVRIAGTFEEGAGGAKATILLFHMAGSNKAEYAAIAPRLSASGYSTLAIDQRSGGSAFGARNETVDGQGSSGSYASALPDLAAALDWAETTRPDAPVYVWGSSYSAALVFVLAAEHGDRVDAVLAFSPGEYLDEIGVAEAARAVTVPIFATSSDSLAEIAAAADILDASPSARKVQFRPESGAHGSSTLLADGNPAGAAAAWAAVEAFLAGL